MGQTTDDKEDVAQALSKYDFLAMPIVDLEKRLVGIVTVDDAMDVIGGGDHGGLRKMAAMLPLGQAMPPYRRFRHLEGPPALADGADAVGHIHRYDPEPLRKRAGSLPGTERLYPYAVRHRR